MGFRQPDVVNLNRAGGHGRFIQGKIIMAGPPPVLGALHQPCFDGVRVHIIQALSKLLGVTHKSIPKLMLPKRAVGVANGVKAKR